MGSERARVRAERFPGVRWLALIAGLAAAAACGGEEPAPEVPRVSPTEAQADQPRTDPSLVSLTGRMRIESQGVWRQARDLAVDVDGRFYVLDGVDPSRILKLDTDGSFLLRFGEDEAGSDLVVTQSISLARAWNTVLFVDRVTNSILAYLTLGMTTFKVQVVGGVPVDILGRPQFNEYYLHSWDAARGVSGVYQMRIPIDTLGLTYQVGIRPDEPIRRMMRDIYYRVASDDDGRLYVGFQDGYPVRVLEPGGATVRLVGIERRGVPRAPEAMEAEAEENLARLRRQAPDLPDSLLVEAARPDSLLPVIEELDVDPRGRLWVRTHRADAGGATPYDVFDAQGIYLARVDVPGPVRATTFGPDGALVVLAGAAGEAGEIVVYEVGLGD